MPGDTAPDFLAHAEGDSVGVATRALRVGAVAGRYLAADTGIPIDAIDPIPMGHKLALRPIAEGAEVIEYGVCIGLASAAIAAGAHVHVHNLRSARWRNSQVG